MSFTRGMRTPLLCAGKRIVYLIRDLFMTDLVAGSVNGTAAEPGPGIRSLIDTTPFVSITGDELKIAGGVNRNDPVLRYGAQSKAVGLAVGAVLYQGAGSAAMIMHMGWDNDALQDLESYRFYFTTGGVFAAMCGDQVAPTYNVGLGAYAALTTYRLALISLNTQLVWCIKGGAWTNWTMLHKDTLALPATIYPGVSCYNRALNVKEYEVGILPPPWDSDVAVTVLSDGDAITGEAQSVLDAFFRV